MVRDLDSKAAQKFIDQGAGADSPAAMMAACDVVITCLPSPAASRAVMTGADGLLTHMGPGKIWMEMSTTDEAEVKALGQMVTIRAGSLLIARFRGVPSRRYRQYLNFCRM